MSAPISPGERIAPSATGSVTTATSSAPFSWQRAASSERSATWPRMLGFWTTTQLVSPSIAASSRSMSSPGRPGVRSGMAMSSWSPVKRAMVFASET
jgi:hypothetical protein